MYVLAPSSTNNPQAMVDDVKWVEEYLSAPAWGRVIFSNERQLQYGDYLIAPEDQSDFMGTTIVWGSDEFKTWEEIITFFERLGGQ